MSPVAVGRGRRRAVRIATGALGLVMVAGWPAACSDDGGAASGGGGSPGGAPLMEGLVVPPGARLVGSVFPVPSENASEAGGGELRMSVALLELDGDPFAAWDDLAEQGRRRGAPLPSSGVCEWWEPLRDSGPPPTVRVDEPRPSGAEALACYGSGWGANPDGEPLSLTAELWWSAEGAQLMVETQVFGGNDGTASSSSPEDDRGPAPASASDDLPPLRPPDAPGAGEPMARAPTCTEGNEPLRVPPGARLLGGGTVPKVGDFTVVLAVDDVRSVLEDLGRQLDPTGPDAGPVSSRLRETDLEGRRVWALGATYLGGGGSCEVWPSPDGRTVILRTYTG